MRSSARSGVPDLQMEHVARMTVVKVPMKKRVLINTVVSISTSSPVVGPFHPVAARVADQPDYSR